MLEKNNRFLMFLKKISRSNLDIIGEICYQINGSLSVDIEELMKCKMGYRGFIAVPDDNSIVLHWY